MTGADVPRSLLDALGRGGAARIFTHNITSLVDGATLDAVLPGHRRFDERALLLAGPDDVVCVVGEVAPAYIELLASLGIGPGADRVVVAGGGAGLRGEAALPRLLALGPSRPAVEELCARMRDILRAP
jgi:hypothetical protein